MKAKSKSEVRAINERNLNTREAFIFIHGGKDAFVEMLSTDAIDEYGNRKVLIRNGELIGVLTDHGLWLKLYRYSSPALWKQPLPEVGNDEVWMRIYP